MLVFLHTEGIGVQAWNYLKVGTPSFPTVPQLGQTNVSKVAN
jgi:hypothetical protein